MSKLKGRFGDTSGRPFVEGGLVLPNRGGVSTRISFLIDTGADQSVLMPNDAKKLGLDFDSLSEKDETLGIGGVAETFIEPAHVIFANEDTLVFLYKIDIQIIPPNALMDKVPSLLGRDIINNWNILFAPQHGELNIDIELCDQIIDANRGP